MGCVDGPTRGKIHRLMSAAFEWDASKCTGCLLCRDNCPNEAITFKDGKISIFDHACKYCMHCQLACPKKAITIDQRGYRYFQQGMALTTREVLRELRAGPGALHHRPAAHHALLRLLGLHHAQHRAGHRHRGRRRHPGRRDGRPGPDQAPRTSSKARCRRR